MSTITIREPERTDDFWEHYTDIGHNDSRYANADADFDWLWIYIDGHLIAKERTMGYTHSQMELPDEVNYMRCFRGSYDVDRKIISVAKPVNGVYSFRDIPSQIIRDLSY